MRWRSGGTRRWRSRARRIPSATDSAGAFSSARAADLAMNSPRWMFSMATRLMKSGCDSWWSKVSSASVRIAATGSRWSTSSSTFGVPGGRIRLFQRRDVELLLVGEVVVDHALGGAGLGGDFVDACSRVAVPGELAQRDFKNLPASPLRVALAVRPALPVRLPTQVRLLCAGTADDASGRDLVVILAPPLVVTIPA